MLLMLMLLLLLLLVAAGQDRCLSHGSVSLHRGKTGSNARRMWMGMCMMQSLLLLLLLLLVGHGIVILLVETGS